MSRYEFLNRLYQQLQPMSKDEVDSIMYDYEEHFEMGLADGKSEAQIVNELGNPYKIAKELKATSYINSAHHDPNTKNLFRAAMATLGLGVVNIFFILPALISYISVIISLIVLTFVFSLSPIFLLLDYVINGQDAVSWFEGFMTLSLVGLGFIFIACLYHVIRISNQLFLKYIQWNVQTVKGAK